MSRRLLILAVALGPILLYPAHADAWSKRLKVDAGEVVRWQTPQRFSATEPLAVSVRIGGQPGYNAGGRRCGSAWSRRGVLVESRSSCTKRAALRIRVANTRRRSVWVRVTYWRF